MKDGFIKVAAGIPEITVADINANTDEIKKIISQADENGVSLLVLPELCVTGASCGELFIFNTLTLAAQKAISEIAEFTRGKYPVTVVGAPLMQNGKLLNCAVVIFGGEILGAVPKSFLPNHKSAYEKRYFISASELPDNCYITIDGKEVQFGADLCFSNINIGEFSFGIEIGEDGFAVNPPSAGLLCSGAAIIANPACADETVGKADYRRTALSAASARLMCGYVTASSTGESTQDAVYSGHSMIFENGKLLAENKPFEENKLVISEIDVFKLAQERKVNSCFSINSDYCCVEFDQPITETKLTRRIERLPFVPKGENLDERAETILQIQSHALKKRLSHTNAKTAVIGISGGLDSTLALLVSVRAMKLLGRPMTDILAITMPCFGTTKRTRSNSEALCELLGVSFKEVNITDSVKQHFKDIGQSEKDFDVTYENSQARERTQVLMDIANKQGGLVIGTGDLSELALGWATYNGDHMSMYGVNCDVPKTLIKYIVKHEAENSEGELKRVLLDILDTPVSPELLPADSKGEIAQKTEDLVGPYELHDFFLYHTVRWGESPEKILRLALIAFPDYQKETVVHWLKTFIRRFFNQQFKRSCVPDGPKVGSVALSPRGDWRMPTDASSALWLKDI